MFDHTSRYYTLETASHTLPDGRVVAYKRRRFLPIPGDEPVLAEVVVTEGDRLDVITVRTLGLPEQFWRVCDANHAMNPKELTDEIGRVLRILLPQAQS
jgi:hypothetical protein